MAPYAFRDDLAAFASGWIEHVYADPRSDRPLGIDIMIVSDTLGHSDTRITRERRAMPEQHKAQVTGYVTWAFSEPPSGFEPETYALRVRCSGHLS